MNLSSQLGWVGPVGSGGFAAYGATDGAIDTFTKATAHEFGPRGITVERDVADAVLALAADEAGYLTGRVLHPSGGWVVP